MLQSQPTKGKGGKAPVRISKIFQRLMAPNPDLSAAMPTGGRGTWSLESLVFTALIFFFKSNATTAYMVNGYANNVLLILLGTWHAKSREEFAPDADYT